MPIMLDSIINPQLTLDWLRKNSTGKGVQVAVIDSGVDPRHPDLQGKISRACVISKDDEGKIVSQEIPPEESTDDFGHGTAVAGIITDIAPDAEIINIRVLNEYNSCSGDILVEGIRWALEQNIKLINMSLATMKEKFFPDLLRLCEQAYEQDAVMVVSRRNVGRIGCPAMFSSVISVERGNFDDCFQMRFKTSNMIECDAHGTEVQTPAPGGGYAIQSGTSFATPHISGFVALLLEKKMDLIPVEIKAILKALATN